MLPNHIKIKILQEKKINELIQYYRLNYNIEYTRKYIRDNFITAYTLFLKNQYFKDANNDEKI